VTRTIRHAAAALFLLAAAILAGCYSFPFNAQEDAHHAPAAQVTNASGSDSTATPPAATAPRDVSSPPSTPQRVTEAQAREQAAQATEAATTAAAAASTLLPPPWNLLAAALIGVGGTIAAQHIRRLPASSGGAK
jgi:hypothetical protein